MKSESPTSFLKIWGLLFALMVVTVVAIAAVTTQREPGVVRAADPAPRLVSYGWMSLSRWFHLHAEHVAVAEAGEARVVFLGDSITEAWPSQDIWQREFVPLGAVGFGIGGDMTQNVLWRLQHGGAGNLTPEAVVLMIGTNNFGHSDADATEVAQGVRAVVSSVREVFPGARVLVFGIFPRDARPNTPLRRQIGRVNQDIAALHDGVYVYFEDIGERFLEPDGTISPEVMPDALHLSAEGYRRWAEAIRPYLRDWLAPEA